MRRLITTTALALVMAAPAAAQMGADGQQDPALGQDGQQGATTGQTGVGADGMGHGQFAGMQQGDLLASELINAEIYAPATGQQGQGMQNQGMQGQQPVDGQQPVEGQQAAPGAGTQDDLGAQPEPGLQDEQGLQETQGMQDQQGMQGQGLAGQQGMQGQQGMHGQRGSRWGQSMTAADLEGMENIGSVSDLLLDEQGNVQAVLVDVGGFLGMGARQVAIGLDQLNFITDADDPSRIYVVSTMGADSLENMPEFDETAQNRGMQQDGMQQGQTQGMGQQDGMQQDGQQAEWRGTRQPLGAPNVERDGFQQAQANEISVDDMLNANLYDVQDDNVGNVTDVVLGPDGEAQYIVADVGGFLGLGAHTVALGFDEVSIMRDDGMTDLRIYVDVTEESLQAMPEYTQN